jgi:ATP/maltotriose-dependent transcriptional regulator MalT
VWAWRGWLNPLTPRELEVLRLLAAGKRNREIASELVVALERSRSMSPNVLEKLGATNRAQAIAHAHELGLLR